MTFDITIRMELPERCNIGDAICIGKDFADRAKAMWGASRARRTKIETVLSDTGWGGPGSRLAPDAEAA